MKSSQPQEPEAQAPDIEKPVEAAAVDGEPAPRAAGDSGRWWLLFGVLLLLGVSAGLVAGYRYWLDLQADLQRLNAVIEEAAREQAVLQAGIEDARRAFAEQEQQMRVQQEAFQSQREALGKEREKLRLQQEAVERALVSAQRIGTAADSDWMLAEAAYLMRLAQQRLALEQDVNGARAALDSADRRLLATGNPRWAEVREVLAGEQSALAAVPEPDLSQLGAALDDLIDQAQGLRLAPSGGAQSESPPTSGGADAPSERSLASLPADLWSGFGSLMKVRRHEQAAPRPSGLSPDLYLQETLRLQLEAARAALARRNRALYQGSLGAALGWLDEFASPDAELSVAFRQRLQALAAVDISPTLPDISASLNMFERRLALAEEAAFARTTAALERVANLRSVP